MKRTKGLDMVPETANCGAVRAGEHQVEPREVPDSEVSESSAGHVAPVAPSSSARPAPGRVGFALTSAVLAAAPAVREWMLGDPNRGRSWMLAVTLVLAVGLLTLLWQRPFLALVGLSIPASIGYWATVPVVGRAPMSVGLALGVGTVAVARRVDSVTSRAGRGGPAAACMSEGAAQALVLVGTAMASVAWVITGSIVGTGVTFVAASIGVPAIGAAATSPAGRRCRARLAAGVKDAAGGVAAFVRRSWRWSAVGAAVSAGVAWIASGSWAVTAVALSVGVVGWSAIGFAMTGPAGRAHRRRWAAVARRIVVAVGSAAPRLWTWPVISISAAIAAFPIVERAASDPQWVVQGLNDYQAHMSLAKLTTLWPFHPAAPHFLLHMGIAALRWIAGPTVGVALTIALAVFCAGFVTWRVGRHGCGGERSLSAGWSVAFVALFLWGESPGAISALWWTPSPTTREPPYMPLHMWGNPASILVLPFALLLVELVVREFGRPARRRRSRSEWVFPPVVVVLGCLAKPSLVLVGVPAIALTMVVRRDWTWARVRWVTTAVLVPATVVIAWQAWLVTSSPRPDLPGFSEPGREVGFRWAPFVIARLLAHHGWWIWALLWLPICAAIVGRRRFLADPYAQFALAFAVAAWVPALLLVETTEIQGANLLFGVYHACVVLYFVSLRFLLLDLAAALEARTDGHRTPVWVWATSAGLAMSVVAGLLAHVSAYGWV